MSRCTCRFHPGTPCESCFTDQVIELAHICGWLCYHTFDSRRSSPGFVDIIAVRGREMLAIELKSQKGKVKPAQQDWLDALQHVETVNAFCWRPEHWPLIEEALRKEAPNG